MKYSRLISLLILLICLIFSYSVKAQESYTFSKEQSYELSNLILLLIPPNDQPFSWKTGESIQSNIYWTNGVKNTASSSLPYIKEGFSGILFSNTGNKTIVQNWVNGNLVKTTKETGYTCEVSLNGNVYWSPLSSKIFIPISPIFVCKHLGLSMPLQFVDYLNSHGIKSEEIWSKGYSGYGEKGIRAEKDGRYFWIICQTSHGANGLVGSVSLDIFLDYPTAKQISDTRNYR